MTKGTKRAVLNPAKRHGTNQPNFILRVVTDIVVFEATDGEIELAGFARIGGEQVIVTSSPGSTAWGVLRSDRGVRRIIPQESR